MARKLRIGLPFAASVVAVLVVLGYAWLRSPESTRVQAGDLAPDLALPSLGGVGTSRLSSFRGKPLLLVLFYSSCPACEAQAPQIERLHRELGQKGLQVIGVSVDEERRALEKLVEEQGLTFVVLLDPGGAAVRAAYGTFKFPEAYLIDARGRVVSVHLGSVDWSSPELRGSILRLLTRAS